MKANLAEAKPVETVTTLRAKLPRIAPELVQLDFSGNATRAWYVRLPNGMIADDLKQPEVWKAVQRSGGKSLRRLDRVTMVSYNEDWIADALVSNADSESVTLTGVRIVQMTQRTVPLLEDETYRVAWGGSGYHVERKADGQRMTAPVQTLPLAERDFRNLYPAPVAHTVITR